MNNNRRGTTHSPSNIVLIGMPGAGKSTLGVLLAKELAKGFVDTDLLIQDAAGKTLQQIVDEEGYLALRAREAAVLANLNSHNTVIATGGSAVYSEAAMSHLKQQGLCLYLQLSLAAVTERLANFASRGVAAAPGTPLSEIYAERTQLYEKYADLTLDCNNKLPQQLVQEMITRIKV